MAVSKVKHSKSSTQPKAQPQRNPDRQRKAEFLEAFHHLNRGYGIALSALDRLETKDRQFRPPIFPAGCLSEYRNRTEALRAVANCDLLRIFAGREDQDATRLSKARKQTGRLTVQNEGRPSQGSCR